MSTGTPDYPAVPCPKCGRSLPCAGVLSVNLPAGTFTVPTYQCDECLMTVDFAGEPMEQALTFAVDQSGRIFDPADPEGELRI